MSYVEHLEARIAATRRSDSVDIIIITPGRVVYTHLLHERFTPCPRLPRLETSSVRCLLGVERLPRARNRAWARHRWKAFGARENTSPAACCSQSLRPPRARAGAGNHGKGHGISHSGPRRQSLRSDSVPSQTHGSRRGQRRKPRNEESRLLRGRPRDVHDARCTVHDDVVNFRR